MSTAKSEAASLHGASLRERPDDYAPGIRQQLQSGLSISAVQYVDALRSRALDRWCEYPLDLRARRGRLAMSATTRSRADDQGLRAALGRGAEAFWAAYPRFTRPFSYLGLPALALPIGFAAERRADRAASSSGRRSTRLACCRAAHHYQQATDWHRRAPALSRPA